MSGIGGKFSIFVIGASALAMASGCATTEQQARVSTYGAPAPEDGVYTGADRVFADGHMDELRRAGAASSIERPDAALLAAYEGVEGARLAHRVFGEARAEALDGACEQYVKIGQGETLYDIASYCDVPVTMLISANPVVHNPRHVEAGQIVEVPQLFNAQRHAMGGASAPAGVQFAIGNVVEPKVMGSSLGIHPVVVVLTLVLFGLLWGIPGMFLATPLTAVIKIVLQQRDFTKPIAKLLEGDLRVLGSKEEQEAAAAT